MTNWLLGGLCLGQLVIACLLLFIFATNWAIHKRLDKMQLSVQEFCDRAWERMWGNDE